LHLRKLSYNGKKVSYNTSNGGGETMGYIMFENQLFDHWLNQKSQEILAKMDKEKVNTEEMLILSLKAQTNHFHHMDIEFRDEFKNIRREFQNVDQKFISADQKFDKKFDRLYTFLMWGFGLLITLNFGLYMKLFMEGR
jgi:hypothetical protein